MVSRERNSENANPYAAFVTSSMLLATYRIDQFNGMAFAYRAVIYEEPYTLQHDQAAGGPARHTPRNPGLWFAPSQRDRVDRFCNGSTGHRAGRRREQNGCDRTPRVIFTKSDDRHLLGKRSGFSGIVLQSLTVAIPNFIVDNKR